MNLAAYPIRTAPLFRDYIWGGRKLQTQLGKNLPNEGNWAESWELIDHPEHHSVITNGAWAGQTVADIATQAPEWLFGEQPLTSLPLLLKYLDCQRVLSVQVHPDDTYGASMPVPDLGKTEAWYIVDAEPGAKLYAGLQAGVTADQLREAMEAGNVDEILHVIEPQRGDCVFIPAGTVHALGAGLLVAEIQQASNTTFRLFDWNRVGNDGQPRPLHVEQAIEVTDFKTGPRQPQVPQSTEQSGRERLVACDKFFLDRFQSTGTFSLETGDTFHYLTAPYGGVILRDSKGNRESLEPGDSVLIPATMSGLTADLGDAAVLLDMYPPAI